MPYLFEPGAAVPVVMCDITSSIHTKCPAEKEPS